jgi:hypothetical protein
MSYFLKVTLLAIVVFNATGLPGIINNAEAHGAAKHKAKEEKK